MAMTIDINGAKAVMGKLEKTVKAIKSPKEALTETGEFLIREFDSNFPTEGKRLGSPWQQLAASTLREKQRLGYGSKGILERTGRMRQNFQKEVRELYVRVFNPTTYFKYHQIGGATLPQRKMISATENIKGKIFEIFNLFIRNAIK